MNLTDLSTMLIALLSLVISVFVVLRDRRQRQIDKLFQCYDRLQQAHGDRPFLTLSDFIEMEDTPNDERWDEYKQKSKHVQSIVERELEFACFLVVKEQINFEMFFYLFRGWLASRDIFWRDKNKQSLAKNHPYTVKVITLCLNKKLLPIKDNPELQKLQVMVDQFLTH